MIIPKQKQSETTTYHYLSVEGSIKVNAERHKLNAEMYLASGNIHHAIGSYKKMIRNYEKVLKLQEFDISDDDLKEIMSKLSNKIADQMMNGSNDTK